MALNDNRIRLTALDAESHPDRDVIVGWDRGMQTYFAQVFDGVDESGEDRLLVDTGNHVGEITYPSGVIDSVRLYAEIPDDLGQTLAAQRAAETSTYSELRQEAGHIARAASLGDTAAMRALLGISDAAWLAGADSHETEHSMLTEADGQQELDELDDGEDFGNGLGY